MGPRALTTERLEHPLLHPGRAARVRVDAIDVGWLGELHPRIAKAFDLPRAPILFEVDLATMMAGRMPVAHPVSKLPIVRRDLAVVVADAVPAQDVVSALQTAKPLHVETIRLFDVYRGPGIDSRTEKPCDSGAYAGY